MNSAQEVFDTSSEPQSAALVWHREAVVTRQNADNLYNSCLITKLVFYQFCILYGYSQFSLDGVGGEVRLKGCYLSLGTKLNASVCLCLRKRE